MIASCLKIIIRYEWDYIINFSLFQISPVRLNPYFKALGPHFYCNREEVILLHYVKNEYHKKFLANYKDIGLFCDDEWFRDHDGYNFWII